MRLLVPAAAAAAVVLCILGTRTKDDFACRCWRFVAGDPGNCRQVAAPTEALPLGVDWQATASGPTGVCKPLAWGNLLVLQARTGRGTGSAGCRLLALNASTGEVAWERQFDSGHFNWSNSFPDRFISDGRLFVTDGDGCLALELASGRTLTKLAPPAGAAGWSYLTSDDNHLFGLSRDGRTVFSISAGSGRSRWTVPLDGAAHVPALAHERLYLGTSAGTLLALRTDSGRVAWSRREPGMTGRTALHVRSWRVLAVGENDGILALNASDGSRIWSTRVNGAFANGRALGPAEAYLLGGSLALSMDDGRRLWSHTVSGSCGPPVLAGSRLLTGAAEAAGRLEVLDRTGQHIGALEGVPGTSCGGTMVSGGRAFAIRGGQILALTLGRPNG